MHEEIHQLPSSYRDPAGFVFKKHGIIYRQINQSYKENFELLKKSGLLDKLIQKGLLISHEIIPQEGPAIADYFLTIKPEQLSFISYPYEWSFNSLKDAALLTLQVAKTALDHGMILKDATPFNVQWKNGRPLFIDTLSFEKFESHPWIAYRQFCECFLGPLLIMHYAKKQMPELLLGWPEGIPIDTIRALIPKRSKFSIHTFLHIHLHASYSRKNRRLKKETSLSQQKLTNLLTSLEIVTKRLKTPVSKSTWSGYYIEAAQREDYLPTKKTIVSKWIEELPQLKTAIDLGANEGEFAQILSQRKIHTIAADFDAYCIDRLYNKIKQENIHHILPLTIDISRPSPAIGVNNEERQSFLQRANVDMVIALALIHHLAIGKNIPVKTIIEMLSGICRFLIIEFIPKQDAKV